MNESLIEKLIAFPEELDSTTQAALKAQIRTDKAAAELARFYEEFYVHLRGGKPSGEEALSRPL